MSGSVVFYRLRTRFLQQGGTPPEASKQIVYYSLAVGHHVGVIDIFSPAMTWPYDAYLDWVGGLPEGEARRKLDGVRRFGEIMIDSSHTRLLRAALKPAEAQPDQPDASFSRQLDEQLEAIEKEPAVYLMVRRQP
jgi:hydrogenase-4 component J